MDDQRTRLRALCELAPPLPWAAVMDEEHGVLLVETVPRSDAPVACVEVVKHRGVQLMLDAVNALPALLDALDAAESLRPHPLHRTGHRCACCGREGAPEADALCPWCSEGRAAERERDDARAEVETLRAEAATLREQLTAATARVDELEKSAQSACQSPADDCDCAGCLYAAERGGES